MPGRKCFTGDEVVIDHNHYPSHVRHRALVVGTRIVRDKSGDKRRLLSYRVDCECGASLMPLARNMELVSEESASDMLDMRRRYFLNEIGVHSNAETLKQQVNAALGILTDKQRAIIIRRFALGGDDGESHTFQAIAEVMGVSKQYINQVETAAMRKLRSFPGIVKEPV